MPYKNIERQKEYQSQWIKSRRLEFFANKKCFLCRTTFNLELHHIDRTKKETHKIWSWSKENREKELRKCIVLCNDCHKSIHKLDLLPCGTKASYDRGCRCNRCCSAHTEYKYWQRHK